MKIMIVGILLGALTMGGCASTPWHAQTYTDGHVLARVVYDQASALANGRQAPNAYVPLLTNTNVVFCDQNGTAVTVRDMAFTILDAAGEVDLPGGPTRSKLIYSCTEKGELLYRVHIPVISDEGFRKTMEKIQSEAGAYRR